MAKWYGKIGYSESSMVSPGVWSPTIVERSYFGDSIRINRSLRGSTETVADNITVGNQISIVADPYANQNFQTMIYAEYMGNLWKVSTVEVQFPRLILTLGGLYTGEIPKPPDEDNTEG